MNKSDAKGSVLFFSYGEFFPFYGGIARYAKSLAVSLSEKYAVTVIAHPDNSAQNNIKNVTIKRPRLLTRFSFGRALASLYFIFQAVVKKPSLIFITDIQSLYFARYLLFLKRLFVPDTKVYVSFYGTEIKDIASQHSLITSTLFERLSPHINTFICISSYTKNLLVSHFPFINDSRISLIYPTVGNEFIKIKLSAKIEAATLKKHALTKNNYLVSTGRLVKRKGHAHILKAFPALIKKNPQLKYVIIGSGPEKNALIELSKKLKIPNHFVIVQATEIEKKALLQNCLLYVHPSIETHERGQKVEGFGIAILEALSVGKTALVHNHGGMKEIITHNQNGLVTNVLNPKKLTEELLRVISGKALIAKLEKQAAKSLAQFSSSVLSRQIADSIKMTNIKRVAYIVEWFYPIIGGAGKQALLLAKHMSDYRITFYTKRPYRCAKYESVSGFEVTRLGKPAHSTQETQSRLFDYASSFQLFLKLYRDRKNIDIVHIHGNLTNNFAVAAAVFARLTKKPVIGKPALYGEFKGHGHLKNNDIISILFKTVNPLTIIRKHIAGFLTGYTAISHDIERELIESGVDKQKIHFIPNGIDTSGKNAKDYGNIVHKKTIRFLTVSRMAQNKGIIDPLLSTWNSYYKNNPHYMLTVVGAGEGLSGSIETEVKQYVAKHKLKNVTLVGQQKNLQKFYTQADVFIIPSHNEGLSNALLEAGSHGLVTIASNVSGNTDVIENEKTGYLFVSGSREDLHHTVEKALQNKKAWKTISVHMMKNIQKNYSIESVSKLYREMYTSLIK